MGGEGGILMREDIKGVITAVGGFPSEYRCSGLRIPTDWNCRVCIPDPRSTVLSHGFISCVILDDGDDTTCFLGGTLMD